MNLYIPTLTLFGLPVSGIIVIIIEFLKRRWPAVWAKAWVALVTAIFLGEVAAALCIVIGNNYEPLTILVNAVAGIIAGLTAVGIYDAVRSAGYRSVNLDGSKQQT
jgi:H+/Cl- antiporter ClcA